MEPMTVCCLLLYIVCFQIVAINSRTSTLWKLNAENGKIVSIVKNAQVRMCDAYDALSIFHWLSMCQFAEYVYILGRRQGTPAVRQRCHIRHNNVYAGG